MVKKRIFDFGAISETLQNFQKPAKSPELCKKEYLAKDDIFRYNESRVKKITKGEVTQ